MQPRRRRLGSTPTRCCVWFAPSACVRKSEDPTAAPIECCLPTKNRSVEDASGWGGAAGRPPSARHPPPPARDAGRPAPPPARGAARAGRPAPLLRRVFITLGGPQAHGRFLTVAARCETMCIDRSRDRQGAVLVAALCEPH